MNTKKSVMSVVVLKEAVLVNKRFELILRGKRIVAKNFRQLHNFAKEVR